MTPTSQAICAHANLLTMKGYDLVAVMLYGSQNYLIDTPTSDVDSKAIVMPSLNDFIYGSRVKPKVIPALGGQIDVKDIRDMFHNYLKSNINFLETLYTETFFVNPHYQRHMRELREHRDLITLYSPRSIMKASAGMAMEKYKRLFHCTESTKDIISQYGYNPKELCHIMRLHYFLRAYAKGAPFRQALVPEIDQRKELIMLKSGILPEPEATLRANRTIESVKTLLENAPIMTKPDYPEAKEFLDCLMEEMLLEHMTQRVNFSQNWRAMNG